MISFNRLGNLGRLGNQMFQYAAIRGIAAYHEYDFCIPSKDFFGYEDKKVLSDINNTIHDVFELPSTQNKLYSNRMVQEASYAFDKNLFKTCPDNVDLFGYFQSYRYFEHIEGQIKKDFSFKTSILEVCQNFSDIISNDYISLHIRRGDYLNLQDCHPVQSLNYYSKAIEQFSDDIPIIIFSDDPEWCKIQKLFSSDRYLISENNETSVDLCLMSMCKYHILANSSLSWWGAWLANSKKTIAPKKWFGKNLLHNNTKDLYLKDWIVI